MTGEVPTASTPSLERDAETLADMGGLAPGRRLDRYELLAPVGRGGMAVVWAARQIGSRGFSKLVAIKTMLPALSADPRFEKMFLAEASLSTSLEHENVCRILDLGESEGLLYLAMEWVHGDTLATLSAARPKGLSAGVGGRIALDVARGLRVAHEARDGAGNPLAIVHRDVSPQNILVGLDGRSKISDFGIAKIEGGPTTHAGFIKGKVRYMAPEQVYCEEIDLRTDVFALGLVLYEMTTGVHPFAGPTDAATLAKIAAPEEAAAPRALRADYPQALEEVVLRAIAKEPSARFASMAELAAALEGALGEGAGIDDVAREAREAFGEIVDRRQAVIDEAMQKIASTPPRAATADRAPRARTIVGAVLAAAAAGITLMAITGSRPAEHTITAPSASPIEPTVAPEIATAPETPSPTVTATASSSAPDRPLPSQSRVPRASSVTPPPVAISTESAAPPAAPSAKKSRALETRE